MQRERKTKRTRCSPASTTQPRKSPLTRSTVTGLSSTVARQLGSEAVGNDQQSPAGSGYLHVQLAGLLVNQPGVSRFARLHTPEDASPAPSFQGQWPECRSPASSLTCAFGSRDARAAADAGTSYQNSPARRSPGNDVVLSQRDRCCQAVCAARSAASRVIIEPFPRLQAAVIAFQHRLIEQHGTGQFKGTVEPASLARQRRRLRSRLKLRQGGQPGPQTFARPKGGFETENLDVGDGERDKSRTVRASRPRVAAVSAAAAAPRNSGPAK